jgi:hypothetical protein
VWKALGLGGCVCTSLKASSTGLCAPGMPSKLALPAHIKCCCCGCWWVFPLADQLLSVLCPAGMEYGVQPQMVRPQLYIASVRTELHREILEQNGITHILQVCCWPPIMTSWR